jgi:pyruvate dehydrogenase E1 component alpha subunit
MQLTNEDLLKLHRDMVLVRLFESRISEVFKTGAVPGFIHLGVGQEACMAGVSHVTKDGDAMGATHREHGVLLCRGSDPNKVMAEIYGKSTGYCKGKGGSMHVCDMKRGSLGNNAILGPGQSIINGYAFAFKMRKNDNIAITIFGDGAANRGDFHEGMNLAALWNLPTIYVLFDNGYALSMPKDKQQTVKNLSVRAAGYGIPGVTADGNDILAVIDAMSEAARRARAGEGPSFIELKTYRWQGHFEGDPRINQPKEEVAEQMKNNDPIKRFEKTLFDKGILDEAKKEAVWAGMKAIVDKAQKFAEESPAPDLKEIYTDVYFDEGRAM